MKRILLIPVFLFSFLHAQTPALNYLTSTDGGSAYEVCLYNNHLYVGCANTLEVWDLTGPSQTPGTMVWKERFLSNIDQISVKDGFMYICANHDGLYKYDLNPNPAIPQFKSHLVPANINESVYDIAFYGDTVAVASKNKLFLYEDGLTSFNYITTIDSFTGLTRIHGVDIKNNFLAYTVGFSSGPGQDGVYLYNLSTMVQSDFYPNEYGNAWDVYFGQNNNLLHVMGGQIGAGSTGYYYVLDYSVPTNLTFAYSDTILGPLIGFACPMNANIINDTVYVATQAGRPLLGLATSCHVYAYDATNIGSIHPITSIYAGLYHFDIEIDKNTRNMYVASEWYGILTMNISNIVNEVNLGNKVTGGWCHGSAYADGRLVEANEGYGIRLFDLNTFQNPIPIADDTTGGFCRAVSFSGNGNHIYSWYLTGDRFRVYDTNLVLVTTIDIDTTTVPADYQKSRCYNNRVAVIEQIAWEFKRLVIVNVDNPSIPYQQAVRQKNWSQDIAWHTSGKLLGLSTDSIIIYDDNLTVLGGVWTPPFSQPFKAFTLSNDTVYAFYNGSPDGIRKYYFDAPNDTLILLSDDLFSMNGVDRIFMASDSGLIYISSTIDQLRAISKSSYSQVAVYDHGADHMFDNFWGVHDLYYTNGHLFLNEYMGLTSIFGAPNNVGFEEVKEQDPLIIYPNPTKEYFTIDIGSTQESLVQIFSLDGKLMYSSNLYTDKIKLSTMGWESGIYLVNVSVGGSTKTGKLVVTK